MRLYEMLERVSEVVYQDNPSPLLTYLKNMSVLKVEHWQSILKKEMKV